MGDQFAADRRRSLFFYAVFLLISVLALLTFNTDLAQYSQHKDTGVPSWFFWAVFPVDIFMGLSLAAAFFYRKWGVFLFPFFALVHHVLYEFYLSTTLLSGLHLLFLFIGAGLLVIIPRWRFYR